MKLIWAQALAYLIAKFGPLALDAVGNLFLAIIKSLTPDQQKEIAKSVGVEKEFDELNT